MFLNAIQVGQAPPRSEGWPRKKRSHLRKPLYVVIHHDNINYIIIANGPPGRRPLTPRAASRKAVEW